MSHRGIISRGEPPIFCSVRCRTQSPRFVLSPLLTVSDKGEKESGRSVWKSRLTESLRLGPRAIVGLSKVTLNEGIALKIHRVSSSLSSGWNKAEGESLSYYQLQSLTGFSSRSSKSSCLLPHENKSTQETHIKGDS